MKDLCISMAPIQGITDRVFRELFHTHFDGVDKYYAPYIRTDKQEINDKKCKDILPDTNSDMKLVPQLMSKNADELVLWCKYLNDLGYQEVNWNLGCPYPMVTKRGLGAGLLPFGEEICLILDTVLSRIQTKFSIKARAGLNEENDLALLLKKLNGYPLSEIIVHPRFAKQLYKGEAHADLFSEYTLVCQLPMGYNGDIFSLKNFEQLHLRFPQVKHFMLGRGLIANPFLASQIHSGTPCPSDAKMRFKAFHDELFDSYLNRTHGEHQVLAKMLGFWEYFSQSFGDSHKVLKRIKKAKSVSRYLQAVLENWQDEWSAQ